MLKNIFKNMKRILTSREVNNVLKMRAVKRYPCSRLLYGGETWTIHKQLESRNEDLEMWILRGIGFIS